MHRSMCSRFKGLTHNFFTNSTHRCYCDSYLLNNPVINTGTFNQGMCYYQCTGNPLEYCGGQARIDIYNLTTVTQLPLPSYQKSSGTYGLKGCYTEVSGVRALSNASTALNTMTPDVCRKYCLGKAFKYFGVEYGREVSFIYRTQSSSLPPTNSIASATVAIV